MEIAIADLADPRDAEALLTLLDAYAMDRMGGGAPLDDEVRDILVDRLAQVPGAFTVIARIDGKPVGLANCFTGFSTFAAAPVVNVHDLVVIPGYRSTGIGRALMAAVEREAEARGAVKLTLEVLTGNPAAQALYTACGFECYSLDPTFGHAVFWQKELA